MIVKQDKWWKDCPAYGTDGPLPGDLGCVSADNRRLRVADTIKLLKSGANRWNKFRSSLPTLRWYRTREGIRWVPGFVLRLVNQDLRALNLSGCHLSDCSFLACDLTKTDLRGAVLNRSPGGIFAGAARFAGSKMQRTLLCGDVGRADFSDCDFRGAELNGVNGYSTKFDRAILAKALLCMHLNDASFVDTDFADSYMLGSELINTDLGRARGLSSIRSLHDVTLDHRTIIRSGLLPRSFYQSCGLPIEFVDFITKRLLRTKPQPSCFISHSSVDSVFCGRLHSGLLSEGFRCFYAPKDFRIGAPLRDTLDLEIARGDLVIVVLSRNSIASSWVEHEVEASFERERNKNRTLLFPIMIDESPMKSAKAWVANLRRQRHIGNFQSWKYKNFFDPALRGLCDDIKSALREAGKTARPT